VQEEEVILVIVTLIVFAGMGILYLAVTNRRALREMEHRERLAMIQRGLIPSPEADPVAFEAAIGGSHGTPRSERWRSAGITIIGLGLALIMLISFTGGAPSVGIGVGGAFAVLGFTLLLNSSQVGRSEGHRSNAPVFRPTSSPTAPPPPPVAPPPPPPTAL
jgi:hypothetical protein